MNRGYIHYRLLLITEKLTMLYPNTAYDLSLRQPSCAETTLNHEKNDFRDICIIAYFQKKKKEKSHINNFYKKHCCMRFTAHQLKKLFQLQSLLPFQKHLVRSFFIKLVGFQFQLTIQYKRQLSILFLVFSIPTSAHLRAFALASPCLIAYPQKKSKHLLFLLWQYCLSIEKMSSGHFFNCSHSTQKKRTSRCVFVW